MQQEPVCRRCGKPIQQVPGHKLRMYCKDGSCKQLASRRRQRDKQLQPLREQWSMLPQATQGYLETLADRYDEQAAHLAFDALKACFSQGSYSQLLSFHRLWSRGE